MKAFLAWLPWTWLFANTSAKAAGTGCIAEHSICVQSWLNVVVTSSIQGLRNSSVSSAHAQYRPASHLGARNCSIERFEFSVRRSKLPEAQNQSSISNKRLFTRTRLRLPLLEMICRGHVGLFIKWHIVLSLGRFCCYPRLPKALPTAAIFSRGLFKVSCAGDCVTRAITADRVVKMMKKLCCQWHQTRVPTEQDEVRLNAPVISLKRRHAAQRRGRVVSSGCLWVSCVALHKLKSYFASSVLHFLQRH